jgi:hypothetical protein
MKASTGSSSYRRTDAIPCRPVVVAPPLTDHRHRSSLSAATGRDHLRRCASVQRRCQGRLVLRLLVIHRLRAPRGRAELRPLGPLCRHCHRHRRRRGRALLCPTGPPTPSWPHTLMASPPPTLTLLPSPSSSPDSARSTSAWCSCSSSPRPLAYTASSSPSYSQPRPPSTAPRRHEPRPYRRAATTTPRHSTSSLSHTALVARRPPPLHGRRRSAISRSAARPPCPHTLVLQWRRPAAVVVVHVDRASYVVVRIVALFGPNELFRRSGVKRGRTARFWGSRDALFSHRSLSTVRVGPRTGTGA